LLRDSRKEFYIPFTMTSTRARCAISLKAVRHSNDDLWSFVMLPDAQW
jgi:hypothetical protein